MILRNLWLWLAGYLVSPFNMLDGPGTHTIHARAVDFTVSVTLYLLVRLAEKVKKILETLHM